MTGSVRCIGPAYAHPWLGLQMVGCMLVDGRVEDNADRVYKLEFSVTICNGIIIKKALARRGGSGSLLNFGSATEPVSEGDIDEGVVKDAIEGTFDHAEVILSHSLTVQQSKLALYFVQWLSTFIMPVRLPIDSTSTLGSLNMASKKRSRAILCGVAPVIYMLCKPVSMQLSDGNDLK